MKNVVLPSVFQMKKHIEEYLLSFNLQQAANLKNNCWPINPECILPVHHKNYFVFRCFEHPQFPNVSDIKNRPIASKQTLYLSVYNWLSESFPEIWCKTLLQVYAAMGIFSGRSFETENKR